MFTSRIRIQTFTTARANKNIKELSSKVKNYECFLKYMN